METSTTTSFKQDYEALMKKIKSQIFKQAHPKEPVPHEMPKEKMEPALKKAVENGQSNKATFVALSESSIIRGGLVGAILTSMIGFNAGKYSRLGAIRKRMRFMHNFIQPEKTHVQIEFTNYYCPNLKTVTKNIWCFSGEQGIGKSHHFRNIVSRESKKRPSLYVSFKASGKSNTFEEDIAQKLKYGEGDNPPMLSEIIRAVRKIHEINQKPYKIWGQVLLTTVGYAWMSNYVMMSQLLDTSEGLILGMLGTAYAYYLYLIYPFMLQSFRRTKVLVVLDDVNKIDRIGQLAQISRFLQLHQENMGNVLLISSDEETWFKLRKQPGLKDRLRQRVIVYDHAFTANALCKHLEDDKNFKKFKIEGRVNDLFTKELVIALIKELIGNRQVTIRRIKSILILNDEEDYDDFMKVLMEYKGGKMDLKVAVSEITQILYQSEMETLCGKLRHIKRQINMNDEDFIKQMKNLLEKGKLLSDNKLGPYLMSYNIVRDSQSQYVFNGKYMYTVFEMAYRTYINNLEIYHKQTTGFLLAHTKFDPNVANRDQQRKKSLVQRKIVTELCQK